MSSCRRQSRQDWVSRRSLDTRTVSFLKVFHQPGDEVLQLHRVVFHPAAFPVHPGETVGGGVDGEGLLLVAAFVEDGFGEQALFPALRVIAQQPEAAAAELACQVRRDQLVGVAREAEIVSEIII